LAGIDVGQQKPHLAVKGSLIARRAFTTPRCTQRAEAIGHPIFTIDPSSAIKGQSSTDKDFRMGTIFATDFSFKLTRITTAITNSKNVTENESVREVVSRRA
jgi:hypothetical protein